MSDKPVMTCEFTRVVHIRFRGEPPSEEAKKAADLPLCPNDHGMVVKILEFQRDHGIYPAVRGGQTGGGWYVASFFEDDAEKIVKFLEEQGVGCVEMIKGSS